MKAKVIRICLIALMATAIAGCGGPSAPGGRRCRGGICVDLELVEPIFLNEPVEVTITVETEEDILGLTIAAGSIDPTILVEGEHKWVVNAKAHTPLQLSTTIRFTKEGYFNIHGSAYDPRKGSGVRDVERVRITPLGGTVNPPPEREPGTPAPAKRLDTPPPKATPESSPTPSSEGKASPEARQAASDQQLSATFTTMTMTAMTTTSPPATPVSIYGMPIHRMGRKGTIIWLQPPQMRTASGRLARCPTRMTSTRAPSTFT
jgi:hypothetical protein